MVLLVHECLETVQGLHPPPLTQTLSSVTGILQDVTTNLLDAQHHREVGQEMAVTTHLDSQVQVVVRIAREDFRLVQLGPQETMGDNYLLISPQGCVHLKGDPHRPIDDLR